MPTAPVHFYLNTSWGFSILIVPVRENQKGKIMARFTANSGSISLAAGQVSTIAGQIRSDVAQMMSQLGALEGEWQGAASAAFSSATTQRRGAQAQVESALDSISQALTAASTTYEDAEARATSLFAG